MTKRDLLPAEGQSTFGFATKQMLQQKKIEFGFIVFASTSSKVWGDYNVHKAFNNIIDAGY